MCVDVIAMPSWRRCFSIPHSTDKHYNVNPQGPSQKSIVESQKTLNWLTSGTWFWLLSSWFNRWCQKGFKRCQDGIDKLCWLSHFLLPGKLTCFSSNQSPYDTTPWLPRWAWSGLMLCVLGQMSAHPQPQTWSQAAHRQNNTYGNWTWTSLTAILDSRQFINLVHFGFGFWNLQERPIASDCQKPQHAQQIFWKLFKYHFSIFVW